MQKILLQSHKNPISVTYSILTSEHRLHNANVYSCANAGRLTKAPGKEPHLALGIFARLP